MNIFFHVRGVAKWKFTFQHIHRKIWCLRWGGGHNLEDFDKKRYLINNTLKVCHIERLEVPEILKSKFQKCFKFLKRHFKIFHINIFIFQTDKGFETFQKICILIILLRKRKSISKSIISLNSSYSWGHFDKLHQNSRKIVYFFKSE